MIAVFQKRLLKGNTPSRINKLNITFNRPCSHQQLKILDTRMYCAQNVRFEARFLNKSLLYINWVSNSQWLEWFQIKLVVDLGSNLLEEYIFLLPLEMTAEIGNPVHSYTTDTSREHMNTCWSEEKLTAIWMDSLSFLEKSSRIISLSLAPPQTLTCLFSCLSSLTH